jgi:hypothetical protein
MAADRCGLQQLMLGDPKPAVIQEAFEGLMGFVRPV